MFAVTDLLIWLNQNRYWLLYYVDKLQQSAPAIRLVKALR